MLDSFEVVLLFVCLLSYQTSGPLHFLGGIMSLATEFVAKYGENYTESGVVLQFLDKYCMFTFQTTSEPLFLLFYVLSDRSVVILTANTEERRLDLSIGKEAMINMNNSYKELAFSEMLGTVN